MEQLIARPGEQYPYSWSPDGRFLAFGDIHPTQFEDIWILSREEEPRPILATPADEAGPIFSPNGKWLAYVSDQSGR